MMAFFVIFQYLQRCAEGYKSINSITNEYLTEYSVDNVSPVRYSTNNHIVLCYQSSYTRIKMIWYCGVSRRSLSFEIFVRFIKSSYSCILLQTPLDLSVVKAY